MVEEICGGILGPLRKGRQPKKHQTCGRLSTMGLNKEMEYHATGIEDINGYILHFHEIKKFHSPFFFFGLYKRFLVESN